MRTSRCRSSLVRTFVIALGVFLTLSGAVAQNPTGAYDARNPNSPSPYGIRAGTADPDLFRGGQVDIEAQNRRFDAEFAQRTQAIDAQNRQIMAETEQRAQAIDAQNRQLMAEIAQRAQAIDARNRQISAETAEIAQRYDEDVKAQNRRVHPYDQGSLIADIKAIGNMLRRYYDSATQRTRHTQVDSNPKQYYYLLDGMQNPIVILSQEGAVVARTRYDVWGQITAQQGPDGVVIHPDNDGAHSDLTQADGQPIGFTGYYKDTESGLYYAKARYYDPRIARFTTQDPEEGRVLQPPSLQKYLYAYTNPTVYSDPGGRTPEAFLQQELSDVATGRISEAEFRERNRARGVGTLVGLAVAPLVPLAADTLVLGGAVVADSVATGSLWGGLTLNAAGLSSTGVVAVETTAAIATGTIAPSVLRLNPVTSAASVESTQAQVAARARQSLQLGAVYENNGVVKAASEAFQEGQIARRLSVRAIDDNGELLPGRTQLDAAGRRLDSGEFGALEFKLSSNAPFTVRQTAHFPYLQRNGGIVVGDNGRTLALRPGSVLKPFSIGKVTGPELPAPENWWMDLYE